MKIESIFERDIFRPINGVVKADQVDESSVWQELDEFVITRELDRHFRKFLSAYCEGLERSGNPSGNIGVWVSGFFGSGKSHFIKVLSYLLQNAEHRYGDQAKLASDFFSSKISDAMLLADINKAVSSKTDVILFNIDSKADHRTGREAILAVFLKVLNEMQGFSGDHPHIAHLERYLESKGKFDAFKSAFQRIKGSSWDLERDAYLFCRDELVDALKETLAMSPESAEKWIDSAESSFALTVENLCKWVKDYLDSKGKDRRIIFFIDEVGQFIGSDSHLMLNLQTIAEDLGTVCKGRAWIVVTSQEDIDAVIGEMPKKKENDFSKIQARFPTRLSLSSSNVDEVIQSRILLKRGSSTDTVTTTLNDLYRTKGDILRNQISFINCGMTLRNYRDSDDFVRNYPFAPYQFQLVQRIFEMIRKAGATGQHLSRGERSILDAFQSASKQVAMLDVGILVPLYRFYPSIESFLDTAVKRTIDQAKDNPSLEAFDIRLLEVLFLVRYVDEFKTNVDNLVTLCLDEIDGDRLALRRRIEASLMRLERETLISRSGDLYFFLTNEERDVNREIKDVQLLSGEEATELGELIFNDVLKEQRKYRFPVNKMDFSFNRLCDLHPIGNRVENSLQVSFFTPLIDDYESRANERCVLDSTAENGQIVVRLGNDESLGRELRTYVQTQKYVRNKNDGTLPEATKRILRDFADDNQERRTRLVTLLSTMVASGDFFVAGSSLKIKSATPLAAIDEALKYLVENTFTRMGYLKRLSPDPMPELQAILRSNDIQQQVLGIDAEDGNKAALDDVRSYIQLASSANRQIVVSDLIDKRYSIRPYGWPEGDTLILLARLVVVGEISLMYEGDVLPVDKAYECFATPAKRRKLIVMRRQTSDPKAIQNARSLGRELFREMGPDGEDALVGFLQNKLRGWNTTLSSVKSLADTGNYPGSVEISNGVTLVRKLLACDGSYKFIQLMEELKVELLEFADSFGDIEHFYQHQKSTWEKLRKSFERFQLNRSELESDTIAGKALNRMNEILSAAAPYGLLREAEQLIATTTEANQKLVDVAKTKSIEHVESLIGSLKRDVEAAKVPSDVTATLISGLKIIGDRLLSQDSLAHIGQATNEAVREFDRGLDSLQQWISKSALTNYKVGRDPEPIVTVKKHRVVSPSAIVSGQFLESKDDVEAFLSELRSKLEEALQSGERIQIR